MQSVKAKSEAGVLVLLVFVLGVLVGGVGNHLWNARVSSNNPAGLRPPGGRGGPGQFATRLHLTPDQQKQVTSIMDDMHSQLQALYGPVDTKGDEVRTQTREKVRAILTPDQQAEFDTMMKERDARGRPGDRGGPPRFGPGGRGPGPGRGAGPPPGADVPVPHQGPSN